MQVGPSDLALRTRQGDGDACAIWCVHGFGASGASFLEAFDAPELRRYSLFVPDFPGFGRSPEGERPQGLHEAAELLSRLIVAHSGSEQILLLGHSAGGLIATEVAGELPQVAGLISIEGNITGADVFFSGKAAAAEDIDTWRRTFVEGLLPHAGADEATRRYCLDLVKAAPRTLREWARTTVEETGETKAGERFVELSVAKLYAYGERSAPPVTLAFLEKHGVPCRIFHHSGHSPMIDEAPLFYQMVAEFIQSRGL
jgi:pimeloyl-ACP methyl ester carboxylesterase